MEVETSMFGGRWLQVAAGGLQVRGEGLSGRQEACRAWMEMETMSGEARGLQLLLRAALEALM